MKKIQNISFLANARVIVISDIHGMKAVLEKLLDKVHYIPNEDYLILLGDYAQRGDEPLKTLRFIMNLTKNERVYALLGNHDHGNYKIFRKKYLNDEFKNYLSKPKTLLYDMYEEYKIVHPSDKISDLQILQDNLKEYFKEEISFLENLPLMLESDDFIFVHAGIDKIRDYRKSYYRTVFMKRYFYYQGHIADKIVICGHMPVTIYAKNEYNDNIIIDLKKKIISIDGGLVIKEGGQLNALVINKDTDKYTYESFYATDLPQVVLKKENLAKNRGKGICWPNYEIELLEKGKYFSKVSVKDTNEITYLKNEYFAEDGKNAYDDCPASILGIKEGEIVEVVNDKCDGYVLIKHFGKQGWIKKEK